MFDSLDEEITRDEKRSSTTIQRVLVYGGIVLVSLVAFGGLYLLVRLVH